MDLLNKSGRFSPILNYLSNTFFGQVSGAWCQIWDTILKGNKWNIENIDTESKMISDPVIVIDSSDNPNICYNGDHKLKFAQWIGNDDQ